MYGENLQDVPGAPSDVSPEQNQSYLPTDLEQQTQTADQAGLIIKPYGFIKFDVYYDSRQPFGFAEADKLVLPKRYLPDIFCRDINGRGQWHMTAAQTRMGITILAPECPCFKTQGIIEAEFFGFNDATIDLLNMRHAYGQLDFTCEKLSLLLGQFWHPMFILDCNPATLSLNATPFDSFSRNPQIRVTKRWNNFELITTILSQRDFQSPGPVGFSTTYLRNAQVPNICAQGRWYIGQNQHVLGIVGDFKRLVPRLVTDKNIKVLEIINSFQAALYTRLNLDPLLIMAKIIYSQNGADQGLLSGYAVQTIDQLTDKRTYSNTQVACAWLDLTYTLACFNTELGLFVAGTKPFGSRDSLFIDPTTNQPIVYKFLSNVEYSVQVTPRILFKHDPVQIGFELDYRRAAYGNLDRFGKVPRDCGIPVNDIRLFGTFMYIF